MFVGGIVSVYIKCELFGVGVYWMDCFVYNFKCVGELCILKLVVVNRIEYG